MNGPPNKTDFIAVSSLASLAFIPRTTKSLKLIFVVDFFVRLFVCFMIIGVRFVAFRALSARTVRCET